MTVRHWADLLALREEVVTGGTASDLQMSLHKAVYQTVDVPYRKVEYYAEITQPTPTLTSFFARVARRLGSGAGAAALFHLDQGMGGGKSHALVGLYHMAAHPAAFFATELGETVRAEAERWGMPVDLSDTHIVTLCADYFSPGKPTENFGPATNLFERFLWSLTAGDRHAYDHYVGMGANKLALQDALRAAGRPVLILLDELLDYAQALSSESALGTMPDELAFLNALLDACDDVPRVAFVVVMMRSEFDDNYTPHTQEFRNYVAARLRRNGDSVAVTEAQDFASIIRKRLFEASNEPPPVAALTEGYEQAADSVWRREVLDKLGPQRGLAGMAGRIEASYPFHPDLMRLVREEWSKVSGFQRVRSTVAIFARTALYWAQEHAAGRSAPTLIGVGDLPLTEVVEQVLSSGLLAGNERSVQGYRSVAGTDITSADGRGGRAVGIDARLRESGLTLGQTAPAVRMATALFAYSLVARDQGRRGASKAELLASVLEPALDGPTPKFSQAEEVFNALTAEDGLGALEIWNPGNSPARYNLSIKQTLRMYHNAAGQLISQAACDEFLWDLAKSLATKGRFAEIITVDNVPGASLSSIFERIDSESTRLVVLEPSRWTLLNGRDQSTRADLEVLFGLGSNAMPVDNAASSVVACVNTQRRDAARKRARAVLAWKYVVEQLAPDELDEIAEARRKHSEELAKLRTGLTSAFQHYVYLTRVGSERVLAYKRFEDDTKSSLNGDEVWGRLSEESRSALPNGLSANFLAALLKAYTRPVTLGELRSFFYKDPRYPLLPSEDELRRVVFALLVSGWEIIDAHGEPLGITRAEQLGLRSGNQFLRQVQSSEAPVTAASGPSHLFGQDESTAEKRGPEGRVPPGRLPAPDARTATSSSGGDAADLGTAASYQRFHLRLDSVSLADADRREQIWKLIGELRRLIDPANTGDPQLLTADITLVSGAGQDGELARRVQEIGGRYDVEDDDF